MIEWRKFGNCTGLYDSSALPFASAASPFLDQRESRGWWTLAASFQRSVWLVTNRSEQMAKDRTMRYSCVHRTVVRTRGLQAAKKVAVRVSSSNYLPNCQFKQGKSISRNQCNSFEQLLFIPGKHPASFYPLLTTVFHRFFIQRYSFHVYSVHFLWKFVELEDIYYVWKFANLICCMNLVSINCKKFFITKVRQFYFYVRWYSKSSM